MSEYKSLEEIKKETKKEQEKYEKYNKDFLSSWANRAEIHKKLSRLVQPLFDKIIDTVVNYCLEIKKDDESNILMESTINKMIGVLNNYCDATEKIDEEDDNEFYKENQNTVEKDPKKFYLDDESIKEINSGDVNISFRILNKTDINIFDEETKISKFTEITYNKESVSEYNINKDMNGSFMYIHINGSKKIDDETGKYIYSSAELILYGLPNNKLKIIEHKKEDQNIIDFENIVSYIFIDSDIHIVNDTMDTYLDKIDSLETLKKYSKDQEKDEPTLEQLSAINAIKQAAQETEQILKKNAESKL